MPKSKKVQIAAALQAYDRLLGDISGLLDEARRYSARTVNAILTATYWLIGWRLVEYEQSGEKRAEYGERLLEHLSSDLEKRYGRGFSIRNLRSFRAFYIAWPIRQTLSAEFQDHEKQQTLSAKSDPTLQQRNVQTVSARSLQRLAERFPLPWSHYVRLLSVENEEARSFYEAEALRGGWSVRQLDRHIATKFYERTLLSKNKGAILLTHADAGQMHLYLNYAREHWTHTDENPPVGLILCAEKDSAVAKYALDGLPNKILAAEYKLALPNEKLLADELKKTRRLLERRVRG